eukprot:NODE_124_length_18806_cov_0.323996.p3 type:complete len:612 gc:universal NODE_124_length_18806_cov_0.323996:5559-7394(+)
MDYNYISSDIGRDHLSTLESFKNGQQLCKLHLIWNVFLDPNLLDQSHQNIVLSTCKLICNLPLYGIRWMIKGLIENCSTAPDDNNLGSRSTLVTFIDTSPKDLCVPDHYHSWFYSFESKKIKGKLDTNVNIVSPRSDLSKVFNTILTTLQHFLTTWACEDLSFDLVEDVFLVLSVLFEASNNFKILNNNLFYNYAVSETMDVKHHFPKWKLDNGFSVCKYPFIMTPSTKADVLRVESMVQMRHELQDAFFRAMFSGVNSPYFTLNVRRDYLIRDALYQIETKHPSDLKKQLRVTFQNEEAIDEGGPQKEFYRLIIRDMFKEEYGLFRYFKDSRMWWFALDSMVDGDCLKEYRLVGELIGIAIYNGIHLDINFPLALYKKVLNEPLDLDDLRLLDSQLANSLKIIKTMKSDVAELGLTFEIEIPSYGHVQKSELCLNGKNIAVTNSNREEYIRLYIDYYLNRSMAKPFSSFYEGFNLITKGTALTLFRADELEELICGIPEISFKELESITQYDGGYNRESTVIKWFWEIVFGFSDEDKKKLLYFTTSSDRVPTGGFSKMSFIISKNGGDTDRVPTAHTCFNVLLLNEYSSKDKLKLKLTTAIRNAEGFGLL